MLLFFHRKLLFCVNFKVFFYFFQLNLFICEFQCLFSNEFLFSHFRINCIKYFYKTGYKLVHKQDDRRKETATYAVKRLTTFYKKFQKGNIEHPPEHLTNLCISRRKFQKRQRRPGLNWSPTWICRIEVVCVFFLFAHRKKYTISGSEFRRK